MSIPDIVSLVAGGLISLVVGFGALVFRAAYQQVNENRRKLSEQGERIAGLEASLSHVESLLQDIKELLKLYLGGRK